MADERYRSNGEEGGQSSAVRKTYNLSEMLGYAERNGAEIPPQLHHINESGDFDQALLSKDLMRFIQEDTTVWFNHGSVGDSYAGNLLMRMYKTPLRRMTRACNTGRRLTRVVDLYYLTTQEISAQGRRHYLRCGPKALNAINTMLKRNGLPDVDAVTK